MDAILRFYLQLQIDKNFLFLLRQKFGNAHIKFQFFMS